MALPTIFMDLVFDEPLYGEAAISGYQKQIVIESLDWSATATHDVSTGVANTGWQGNSVSLSKVFDSASTALYANMKVRKGFTKAIITVVDMTMVNDRPVPMMQMVLKNGHVDDISTKATETEGYMKVAETLKLSFTEGELRYFPSSGESGRAEAIPFQIPKVAGKKS